jgi:hypothetical protein
MEQGQTACIKRSCTRRHAPCFSMSSNVVGNIGHNGFPRSTTGIRRTWLLLDEVAASLADLSLCFSSTGRCLDSPARAFPVSMGGCSSTKSLVDLLEIVTVFIFSDILLSLFFESPRLQACRELLPSGHVSMIATGEISSETIHATLRRNLKEDHDRCAGIL